jgi:hypothetical protein
MAFGYLLRRLQRQPSLARPSRPGEGDQTRIAMNQYVLHFGELKLRPTNDVAGTGKEVWYGDWSRGNGSFPSW